MTGSSVPPMLYLVFISWVVIYWYSWSGDVIYHRRNGIALFTIKPLPESIHTLPKEDWWLMGHIVLVANTAITSPCVPFSSQMKTFSALLALSAGNSQFTGQFPRQRPVCGALMFSLISAWINGCVNTCKAGDYHDVTVMCLLWYDITYTMTMASAGYRSNYVLTNDTPQSRHQIFRVAGSLCGEFTGHRWIPL